jgi:tetratricopeptide (TPR) repeat protein
MQVGRRFYVALVFVFAVAAALAPAHPARAQSSGEVVYHKIEGRLRIGNDSASNVRVRLLRDDQQRTIAETFSRSGGEFEFGYLPEGNYIVATDETKELEGSSLLVRVQPWPRTKPLVVHVDISITRKASTPPAGAAPGVVAADVDLSVPKEALKHYRAGMKALDEGKDERALAELGEAVKAYPDYYAARVELGRALRDGKRFAEAEEALRPLLKIAPKHSEVWLQHAVVMLDLARRDEAARELTQALALDERDWAAHYYLGWALIETDADKAEPHLARALELDERKAVRAHLALARIADARGRRQQAIEHLEAFIAGAPDSADAPGARSLAEQLRRSKP